MNPEQKEFFRLAILRVLDLNRTRYGLGTVALVHHLAQFDYSSRKFGGDMKAFESELMDALQYLTDKGLIEEALKVVSRENRAWRITTDGIAYIDSQG